MDYFKSLSSAASAVLAKGGPFPNFSIGELDTSFEGKTIWSLHKGTKRDDSSSVSILVFDSSLPAHNPRRSQLSLAKNALRKLRTTRHPDVLRLIDSAETPTAVYIAVEPVRPLGTALEEAARSMGALKAEWVGWGLSRVTTAIKFINADAQSTHGNIRVDSIFIAQTGEWRLGGFETLSSPNDDAAVLYNQGGLVPDAMRYAPPEVRQQGWQAVRSMDPHMADSFSTGLLIMEAYNGSLPAADFSSAPPAGKVPAPIYAFVRRMMVPNAKNRASTAALLAEGDKDGGFFAENKLVKVAKGLDGFMLASDGERAGLLKLLNDSPKSFPAEFLQHKVLPALVQAITFTPSSQTLTTGNLQAPKLLPLVLQLGIPLSDPEWTQSVAPVVLKSYTSADRAMRMALLENLQHYSQRFDQRAVSDKIWPNLLSGFADSVAAIREATLKAILPLALASKLSDRILNNELLRQLAKTQVDPEASIRTNTTILLGRLAPSLSLNTRRTVLVPAFGRSLKDAFVHARVAGLMAIMATADSYDVQTAAKSVLPIIIPSLVDGEKIVRDQAEKGVAMFLQRVQEEAAKMPATLLPPEGPAAVAGDGTSTSYSGGTPSSSSSLPDTLVSSAGGAASALASWAMSSAMSQLTKNTSMAELQNTSLDGRSTPSGGASAATLPTSTGTSRTSSPMPSAMSASAPSLPTQAGEAARRPSGAMKLGGGAEKQGIADLLDDSDDWMGFSSPAASAPPRPKKVPPQASASAKARAAAAAAAAASAIPRAAPSHAPAVVSSDWDNNDGWDDGGTNGALGPSSSSSASNDWGTFEEGADPTPPPIPTAGAPGSVLTREEKRIEMERKREERKAVSGMECARFDVPVQWGVTSGWSLRAEAELAALRHAPLG